MMQGPSVTTLPSTMTPTSSPKQPNAATLKALAQINADSGKKFATPDALFNDLAIS